MMCRKFSSTMYFLSEYHSQKKVLTNVSLFMLSGETSADGLKQHDEIFCEKILLMGKILQKV